MIDALVHISLIKLLEQLKMSPLGLIERNIDFQVVVSFTFASRRFLHQI